MNDALLFLALRSWRNRLARRFSRLRQPRYGLGAIVGAAYLYFFFLRPGGGRTAGLLTLIGWHPGPWEVAASLGLFVFVAISWVWPSSRPAVPFSSGEVQFLFPAPFTRRQLVRYVVLRSQFGAAAGSLFTTLVFRPGSLSAGWTFFVGILIAMVVSSLHLMGVGLRRQSLAQHRGAGMLRQWLPLAVVVAAVVVLVGTVAADWARLSTLSGPGPIADEVERLGSHGAAAVVLWPFRAVVRLPLSGNASAFLRALPLGLLIVVLNFFWVEQSDASFEEASARFAETVAQQPAGVRTATPKARDTTPFRLGRDGAPEVAILWKNLILVGRYVSLKSFIRFLPIIVFAAAVSRSGRGHGFADTLGAICLFGVAITVLLGPQMARNDLREDLPHLAVLRTWPIRGAAMVRGEVLGPTAILAAVAWLFVLGAAFMAHLPTTALGLASRASMTAAALIVVPGIILMQVIVQNALALLFPSWVQIGPRRRGGGVDIMGQRLLMLAGMILVFVVALLPASIVAGVVGLAIYRTMHVVPVVIPAIIVLGVLVVQALVSMEMLGRVFERTDPQAIDAPV